MFFFCYFVETADTANKREVADNQSNNIVYRNLTERFTQHQLNSAIDSIDSKGEST